LVQDNVLSSLICNFLLSICLKKIATNFKHIINNRKNKKYGICLNFGNNFIFCFNNKSVCDSFLISFTVVLKTFGLYIRQKKTVLFTFLKPVKFEILG